MGKREGEERIWEKVENGRGSDVKGRFLAEEDKKETNEGEAKRKTKDDHEENIAKGKKKTWRGLRS